MIGHPKRLEDLARIEAGVKVTCCVCRRERLLDSDQLIHELTRRGHSTAWDMLPARLRCACGSKRVEILAMPFSDGEKDGEVLFDALLRAIRRSQDALASRAADVATAIELAASALELHKAQVAMRAWIVGRDER